MPVLVPVITIGYKCGVCGRLNVNKVNLFDVSPERVVKLKCDCENSRIIIARKEKNCIFRVSCFDCGCIHSYSFAIGDLFKLKSVVCPYSKENLFYVGSQESVVKMLEKLESDLNIIAEEMGLKSQFVNQDIMIQILDKIHDYAHKGNIQCSCGNPDLFLRLMSNAVLLTCEKCCDSITINARNIEDLLALDEKGYVQLISRKTQRTK
ncbi:hypothetical protein [Caldanaerobius polysaccharolyticus]|uniref:hypothetical protein n=1 Tax=Caldanaerobius polysaccharolyticus TaxID=44256 RepID=UPI00047C0891|nr:hypothetical protein [Caldanaerobius polysaccharolyticus]